MAFSHPKVLQPLLVISNLYSDVILPVSARFLSTEMALHFVELLDECQQQTWHFFPSVHQHAVIVLKHLRIILIAVPIVVIFPQAVQILSCFTSAHENCADLCQLHAAVRGGGNQKAPNDWDFIFVPFFFF